jgi:hypothetical protein
VAILACVSLLAATNERRIASIGTGQCQAEAFGEQVHVVPIRVVGLVSKMAKHLDRGAYAPNGLICDAAPTAKTLGRIAPGGSILKMTV